MKPSAHSHLPASSGPEARPGADEPWVEHLGWVRRLALRLARDEAAADDLVQRTALVALRRREAALAADEGGGLRGWLQRVLHNEARAGWRRDRNRRARERDYAVSAGPRAGGPRGEREEDFGRAEESLEFTKRLVASLEKLDETYREVMVARYMHGKSSGEIAESLGVPLRTVETRLRRARIEMREDLGRSDFGRGGRAGSWAPMVLVGWGGPDLGGLVSGAKWGSGWLQWIMIMKVKVVLAVSALLLVGLFGVLQWSASDGPPPAPSLASGGGVSPPGPEVSPAAAPVEDRRREVAADAVTPDPVPTGPAMPESTDFVAFIEALPAGTLDVWVVDEASRPVVGAQVLLAKGMVFSSYGPPVIRDETPRQVQSVTSDPRLAVRFEDLGEGRQFLQVTSPGGAKRVEGVDLDGKRGETVVIRFGSGRVFGRVTDGTGGPLKGAELILMQKREIEGFTDAQRAIEPPLSRSTSEASTVYATTDRNGEYRFEQVVAGEHSFRVDANIRDMDRRTKREIPERFLQLDLGPGEQRRVNFPPGSEVGAATWRGRVLDALGQPVMTPDLDSREALIRVASCDAELLELPAGSHLRGRAAYDERIRYGIDGTFELRLPPGRYDVWLSSPHHPELHHVVAARDFELSAEDDVVRDLTLPGVTLRGTVDGVLEEKVRAWVKARPYGRDYLSVAVEQGRSSYPVGMNYGGLNASGTFSIFGLGPRELSISCRGCTDSVVTIPEGATEVTVVLLPE